ncbi:MAG: acetyl-CoA carboxylase biotin carboxyl carrier protein [Candidatus Limnocylindria bacterium]
MSDRTDPILAAVDLHAPPLDRAGLDEVELTYGELAVRLARPRPIAPPGDAKPDAVTQDEPAQASSADGHTPFGAPSPGMRFVAAPLTGVWYPAPSPGARPYVNEGDEIGAGHVIGLIEAMKLFNEIKSDATGRITRVLVESGTLVKRKQPLLEVDPR